jgi:hypothetical protein
LLENKQVTISNQFYFILFMNDVPVYFISIFIKF